jgi:dihydrofolate synthase/folylpolyglutamate synthase
MRTLCAALGNPQTQFPSVLIAGTNGKGSTAATLASILAAAGYRTGLYTSPHLVRVNERIVVLDERCHPERSSSFSTNAVEGPAVITAHGQIPDDIFARLYSRVDDTASTLITAGDLPHHPSFFEMLTALGFLYFAESKVDIAVLEVGLGGRLDATNIVEPLLSIITDIALDHQEYLGNTIAEITREKAGILRRRGTLITLPQHPQANQAIGEAAADLDLQAISAADLIPSQLPQALSSFAAGGGSAFPGDNARVPHPSQFHRDGWDARLPRNRYTVTLDNQSLRVDSPLSGHHQQRNIALAIAAAVALRNQGNYKITHSAIEAGIRDTAWPGRLEFLPPDLLLDVAHNPAGAWTLRAAIAQLPEDRPRTLLFSCLSDKNLTEMSRILFPLFDSSPAGDRPGERPHDHIVLAPIPNPRAARVEDLLAAAHALDIPAHAAPHLAGALSQARQITPPGGLIIATGSVYLIGAIRDLALSASR